MINFYISGNPVHDSVILSLYEGCKIKKSLIYNFEYSPSDIAVIFGFFKSKVAVSAPRGLVYKQQRSIGKDVIVLETGYIKRGDGPTNYYAVGLNGLNGRANFKNKGSPGDRWNKLGIPLKPWRANGEYILFGAQVPWDASVDHISYEKWVINTVKLIQAKMNLPIVFRPHPLGKMPPIEGCIYSDNSLEEDLSGAKVVVSFNSNIGVDAVLCGIPTVAFDPGSMVYSVSGHHFDDISLPIFPDRTQWSHDIAYTQWTPAEMASGMALDHILSDL